MSSYNYLFKCILIGETSVGKSCLLLQFVSKKWSSLNESTIGVEFAARNIILDATTVRLHLWDTAGQENYRSMTRSYYRNAVGCLLVYDITRRETFNRVSTWLQELRQNAHGNTTIVLVGNKSDEEEHRAVSREEAERFANSQGICFIETSARSRQGVEEAFTMVARHILGKVQSGALNVASETERIKVGSHLPVVLSSESPATSIRTTLSLSNALNWIDPRRYCC